MISATRAVEPVIQQNNTPDLKPLYMEALTLVERLHRRLLDVIKDEFERSGRSDVNSVQALLLFNIGDAELTAGELRSRGYYLGSNVSYNLKKLVEMGFIHHQRAAFVVAHDLQHVGQGRHVAVHGKDRVGDHHDAIVWLGIAAQLAGHVFHITVAVGANPYSRAVAK